MAIACATCLFSRSSLETALRGIREMGFQWIDLAMIDRWIHVNPTDLVRDFQGTLGHVDSLLRQYQLVPIVVNSGLSPLLHDRSEDAQSRRQAETEALIRFMNHYGIAVSAVQPRTPDPTRPRREVLADSAATMRDMMSMASGTGVTFALECHSGSIVETMAEVREMMQLVPELTYAYDPTHFVMKGERLEDTLPLLERASYVALRDAKLGHIQARYGEGVVDFDWILRRLKECGYQGDLSIEYLEEEGVDLRDDVVRLRDKIAEWFPA